MDTVRSGMDLHSVRKICMLIVAVGDVFKNSKIDWTAFRYHTDHHNCHWLSNKLLTSWNGFIYTESCQLSVGTSMVTYALLSHHPPDLVSDLAKSPLSTLSLDRSCRILNRMMMHNDLDKGKHWLVFQLIHIWNARAWAELVLAFFVNCNRTHPNSSTVISLISRVPLGSGPILRDSSCFMSSLEIAWKILKIVVWVGRKTNFNSS